MKKIGFPISHKENEKRRAILPDDVIKLTNPQMVYIEDGFGDVMGVTNREYEIAGCNIATHEEVIMQDIICDPKIGDADYLDALHEGQVIFGWIHATQNRNITDKIINGYITAYAWENMFEKGRHVFWFNNELAGEAAVIHAFQCYGKLPYGMETAVIGNGNTARGAVRVLNMLGSHVIQFTKRMEQLLREEIANFDVIVNCVLWDVSRDDHIIFRDDLKRMKKNSMIIDVSCDRHGGIETSEPTTITNPTYSIDGILHYSVDHTPSLFYKTFSINNSRVITAFIDRLMNDRMDETLQNALIIKDGIIIDTNIIKYQGR